jgi:hypothetical protein
VEREQKRNAGAAPNRAGAANQQIEKQTYVRGMQNKVSQVESVRAHAEQRNVEHTHTLSAVGTISVSRRDRISGLTFLPQVPPRFGPVSVAISSELQQERLVVRSVRPVEYSPVHSQSVCPCHVGDHSGLSFPLLPKNAAQNRL